MHYACELANCFTKQICQSNKDSDLYLRSSQFKIRQGHWLSRDPSYFYSFFRGNSRAGGLPWLSFHTFNSVL